MPPPPSGSSVCEGSGCAPAPRDPRPATPSDTVSAAPRRAPARLPLAAAAGRCAPRGSSSTATRRTASCRSEEHTSELQSPDHLVCRLLLEKKKTTQTMLQTCTQDV